MDEDQYCPVCYCALSAEDIGEGWCPECGADLTELADFPSAADPSGPSADEADYGDDLEKAIIATLFFMNG